MGEEISQLVDGELEDAHLEITCAQLKRPDGMATWVCYHVIGDTLRGTGTQGTAFTAPAFSRRFSERLAAEPTVLAPRAQPTRPLAFAWAAAAGVAAVSLVGWVAFTTLQTEPAAIAKAGEAGNIRPASVVPRTVPADYLLAHREYSPTTQIQGVGPSLRSVGAPGSDVRQ